MVICHSILPIMVSPLLKSRSGSLHCVHILYVHAYVCTVCTYVRITICYSWTAHCGYPTAKTSSKFVLYILYALLWWNIVLSGVCLGRDSHEKQRGSHYPICTSIYIALLFQGGLDCKVLCTTAWGHWMLISLRVMIESWFSEGRGWPTITSLTIFIHTVEPR